MRTTIFTVASLAVALFSMPALAAPADADESARSDAAGEGGATVYDFEDDDVDGEILSPEGANLSSRLGNKHASMISIRPHFIAELIKMSYDI